MHRLADGSDRIVKRVCKRLAYPAGRVLRSRIRPNSREQKVWKHRHTHEVRMVHGLRQEVAVHGVAGTSVYENKER